jgi:SAM-dependent methyltransferase
MAKSADLVTDPANAAAADAWDGDDGDFWVAHATRFDRSIAAHDGPLFDAAGITAGEHVLDIGCGTGHTTRDAARRAPQGTALGIDLSSRMLECARARALEAGLSNVRFEQADAQIHAFEADAFDVALSRTGTMFFGNPVAAFTNIARAIRPDGRLVLLVWQTVQENEWIREFSSALAAGRNLPPPPAEAPGPFSMADPMRVRTVLGRAGFTDIDLRGHRGPMYFGEDAGDAFEFVASMGYTQFMLRELGDRTRAHALEALRASIEAHAGAGGVSYDSATWVITASRGR